MNSIRCDRRRASSSATGVAAPLERPPRQLHQHDDGELVGTPRCERTPGPSVPRRQLPPHDPGQPAGAESQRTEREVIEQMRADREAQHMAARHRQEPFREPAMLTAIRHEQQRHRTGGNAHPQPGIKQSGWPNVFMKLLITQDGFANLVGPTMFLDLDLVVLDDIDCFFDYQPGKNCIIHNWIEARKEIFRGRPDIGNSSIFRFVAGQSDYIYQTFIREMSDADDRSKFQTEQAFLTYAMKEKCWWPDEWVTSFKRHCRPIFPLNLFIAPKKPVGAKFLVFHGHPDPVDAGKGHRGKRIHHRMLPAPWVAEYWKL